MRAVVVYESMFGNTRMIAEAIGAGLARGCAVAVLAVAGADAERLVGVDLLVVGGPTHAWGMSRPSTRKGAATQAQKPGSTLALEPGTTGVGLREWIADLPVERRCSVAAFDTRAQMSHWLTGRASTKIARALRQRGYRSVVKPNSFLVTKQTTELVAGEVDRARAWGEQLSTSRVTQRPPNVVT